MATMIYKIINNLIDIEASLYLTPTTSATRGHSRRYLYIQARINAYHHSFFPSAVRVWNRLPAHLVTATSLEQFKILINYNFTNVQLICLYCMHCYTCA